MDELPDKRPWEWTEQALKTFEEATESYMVRVIAKSHFWMQQLMSCRFSTCQLLWQDREVGYS